jgi:hypothetical protein
MNVNHSEDGNTVLVFQGTYEDFDRLFNLFSSGTLEQMLGLPVAEIDVIAQSSNPTPSSASVDLSCWFTRSLLAGWEYESALLGTIFSRQLSLAFGTRASGAKPEPDWLRQLYDDNPNLSFQAALALGKSPTATPELIQALVERLSSCDAEMSWQVSLSLGQLVLDHPKAAIAQRKEITIGRLNFEILIALRKVEPEHTEILLQLYSTEDPYLPSQLALIVQSSTGDLRTETQAETACLRLSLIVAPRASFTLQIVWNEDMIQEHFTV